VAANGCRRSSLLVLSLSHGFGAVGEAVGEANGFAFSAGPSFTVLASTEPSGFFHAEPLTSSFCTMSFIVAAFLPFVIVLLSVTLKTRDAFLPAIVNVLVF